MVQTEHRIGGRLRAAGCRPTEETAIVLEEQLTAVPKDSIIPILADTIARRRQWSPRSLKIALRDVMEQHCIDGRAHASALGMEESQFCKSVQWELDTPNAGYLAKRLGLAVPGLPEMPVFISEVA